MVKLKKNERIMITALVILAALFLTPLGNMLSGNTYSYKSRTAPFPLEVTSGNIDIVWNNPTMTFTEGTTNTVLLTAKKIDNPSESHQKYVSCAFIDKSTNAWLDQINEMPGTVYGRNMMVQLVDNCNTEDVASETYMVYLGPYEPSADLEFQIPLPAGMVDPYMFCQAFSRCAADTADGTLLSTGTTDIIKEELDPEEACATTCEVGGTYTTTTLEFGETICNGDYATYTCIEDNDGCARLVPEACNQGEQCNNGACEESTVQNECTQGERYCVDNSNYWECVNPAGTWVWDRLSHTTTSTYYCDNGEVKPICGDGECVGTETELTCASDCAPSYCGDGNCDATETFNSCNEDCGDCNNNTDCSPGYYCDTNTCRVNPYCGDGNCDATETFSSCSDDCEAPLTYGDLDPADSTKWCLFNQDAEKLSCYPRKESIALSDLDFVDEEYEFEGMIYNNMEEKLSSYALTNKRHPICMREHQDYQCEENSECVIARFSDNPTNAKRNTIANSIIDMFPPGLEGELRSAMKLDLVAYWLGVVDDPKLWVEDYGICITKSPSIVTTIKQSIADAFGWPADDPRVGYVLWGGLGLIAAIIFFPRRR